MAVADSSCRLDLWLRAHRADVAVVRPDRVVYGLYMAEELPAALSHLCGTPGPPVPGGAGGEVGAELPQQFKLRRRPSYALARLWQLVRQLPRLWQMWSVLVLLLAFAMAAVALAAP